MAEYKFKKARSSVLGELEWSIEKSGGGHTVFIRCVTCGRILTLNDAFSDACPSFDVTSCAGTEYDCVVCPACGEHFFVRLYGLMMEARRILTDSYNEDVKRVKKKMQSSILFPGLLDLGLVINAETGEVEELFDDEEL